MNKAAWDQLDLHEKIEAFGEALQVSDMPPRWRRRWPELVTMMAPALTAQLNQIGVMLSHIEEHFEAMCSEQRASRQRGKGNGQGG